MGASSHRESTAQVNTQLNDKTSLAVQDKAVIFAQLKHKKQGTLSVTRNIPYIAQDTKEGRLHC